MTAAPNSGARTFLARDVVFFTALLATTLALGGALAHAFELPNKMGLSREDYFVVQQIYAGWANFAYLLLVQVVAIIALAVLFRHRPAVLWPAMIALAFWGLAQADFWIFTYPGNIATENWTTIPENWAELRRQWEYSHLAGAVFQLGAACSLFIAALARGHAPAPPPRV